MHWQARELLKRIDAVGGRLVAVEGVLEYEGPVGPLTPELRGEIGRLKPELLKAVGSPLVAALVARMADYGVWPERDGNDLVLLAHAGHSVELLPSSILAEAESRKDELAGFLDRPPGGLTGDELEVLGFPRDFYARVKEGGGDAAGEGWIPARAIWPEGCVVPAAAPDAASGRTESRSTRSGSASAAAASAKHKAEVDTAQAQGELW